jgi:hypothetical protein
VIIQRRRLFAKSVILLFFTHIWCYNQLNEVRVNILYDPFYLACDYNHGFYAHGYTRNIPTIPYGHGLYGDHVLDRFCQEITYG